MNRYADVLAAAEMALQAQSDPNALREALSGLVTRAPLPGPYWEEFTPDMAVMTITRQREHAVRLALALDKKIEGALLDTAIAGAIRAAMPKSDNVIHLGAYRCPNRSACKPDGGQP